MARWQRVPLYEAQIWVIDKMRNIANTWLMREVFTEHGMSVQHSQEPSPWDLVPCMTVFMAFTSARAISGAYSRT
jgi:hypothetical protein